MGQNVVFWAFWVFPKFQILFSFNFVIKVSNNIVRAINVFGEVSDQKDVDVSQYFYCIYPRYYHS